MVRAYYELEEENSKVIAVTISRRLEKNWFWNFLEYKGNVQHD